MESRSAALPAGTVTMVFTDIEGSTALLQSLGDRYGEVLSDHNRLIREAFARHDAFERGSAGDGLYFVFASAREAVQAAVDAQLALAGHPWPDGAAVRDRMGIHTGEPRNASEGYVGLDVHRAARICSAGHGGQILVSQTTRDLVAEELKQPLGMADLGAHRLRSLDGPAQRIFQVTGPGLARDFPPPRTGDAPRNNIRLEVTSFVGREREIEQATRMLDQSSLLTLTGPGASERRGSGCGWRGPSLTASRMAPGSSNAEASATRASCFQPSSAPSGSRTLPADRCCRRS